MGFITSNQGRPIQGVSQQPPKNRYPGQCTKSENFTPDVVRGLMTRPGTQTNGLLASAPQGTNVKWHHYIRDDEEYLISVDPAGVVKAWSPDGTAHTVNVEDDADDYLTTTSPKEDLELMTIGDYTFIINKEIEIEASSSTAPALVNQALIYCQFCDYAQLQKVYIDDVEVAWHQSLDGGSPEDKHSVRPTIIIQHFDDAMSGGSGNDGAYGKWDGVDISATYEWTVDGNTLAINRKDWGSFSISIDDGIDGANCVALYREVEQVTLLPNKAPADFTIKINPPGGETVKNASYWLKATTTEGESGNTLSWEETLEPGSVVGFNVSTMPVVLVRESVTSGVATFTLRNGEWEDREIGNDDSNPMPSFVGNMVKTIGVMQNRLFLTAGEAVIMSRAGEFFNFFRATAQATLDTDPIDIYADSEQINFFKAAKSFDGDMVFFSDFAQFILSGEKPLTSTNAVLRKSTNFASQLSAHPVESGDSIFFLVNYGQFAGVREFFTDSVVDTKRARPVTDHVKEYIVGTPDQMITSTNLNLLLIKAQDANVLYTYDWLWQGQDKVQSAWGKWVFDPNSTLLHMAFNNDRLRLVFLRPGPYVYCETIDLGDADSEGLDFAVRVDRQVIVTFTKDTDDIWKATDPLPDEAENDLKVIRISGYTEEIGDTLDFERISTELWAVGDYSEEDSFNAIVGRKYNCSYSPTNPVAKDQDGQAMNLDKLTVGSFYVNYITCGDMTATVSDLYGNSRVVSLGNRTFGGPENIIGFAPLVEGQHRIAIRARSDKYTLSLDTESHIPLTIRDFSFNGNLNRRGQRI